MIKIITTYGQLLLLAMGRTLLLAFLGLIFACILGMIFGLLSVVKNKACNIIAQIFVFVIRGVPMIVLAFYVLFGIPYLLNTILGIGNGFTLSALQAGVICLALNCGAYMAEIIRAGIQSVDIGQMEAGRSLGLPYWKTMRKIILPQAIRTMIPSIINQFIISLKDTSLVSVIGPRELTQNGKIIAANSASMVMPIWICVALFYLVVCTILSRIAKYVERRVSYGK